MPYVRSPRGARTRFSPARVQATVTKAYGQAFGGQMTQWRQAIQEHSKRIVTALGERHGVTADAEWPRVGISQAVEDELRLRAPTDVHEAWVVQHPERAVRPKGWNRFEGADPLAEDRIDPVWSVQRPGAAATALPAPAALPLAELGEPARQGTRKPSPAAPLRAPAPRRSDWLAFWQRLGEASPVGFDRSVLESVVRAEAAEQRVQTSDSWWRFWQDRLERALQEDPRAIALWRLAMERQEQARLLGQDWLDGSGLPGYEGTALILADGQRGRALYRRLWQEHITRWASDELALPGLLEGVDVEALARHLEPARDQALDWSGWTWLITSDALWPIRSRVWRAHPAKPHHDAREMPQWAWMRLALALAPMGPDRHATTLRFYEALSTLKVVPSETLLREAGRRHPNFCEDRAVRIADRFEAIQEATHLAAVATKWTGSVALDWSAVRAQGSPIAGRRVSQGVVGFLRPVDLALEAQGREGVDRPVTVSLPIWHRDLEAFMDLRQHATPRLQVVVTVPDLFLERARAGASWTLLDPGVFPEVLEGTREAYEKAEAAQAARLPQHPAAAKTMSAERLWRRLIRAMSRGSPFVAFSGPARAAALFGDLAPPIGGLDGVGAFPVAATPQGLDQARWPAMAVNLAHAVDADGTPQLEGIRDAAEVAMRMLDQAVEASGVPDPFRPVCLGVVGYYEAIVKASASASGDPALISAWVGQLAETWATVVALADQQLVREYGPAAVFLDHKGVAFSPQGRQERLALARGGQRTGRVAPGPQWQALEKTAQQIGQRCTVRTVWAPFLGAARIAGATPGGLGTLRPVEALRDDQGCVRWVPTAFLRSQWDPEGLDTEWKAVLQHPERPERWPERLRALTHPDAQGWETRLAHAALIQPWIDQGVCLTLPSGMDPAVLEHLVQRAWWLGLSSLRLESNGNPDAGLDAQDGE